MQNKPKLPPTYVELVGAVVHRDTPRAWQFTFGNVSAWVPKKSSKIIEDGARLQVLMWYAKKYIDELHGEFVEGSMNTRMQPMGGEEIKKIKQQARVVQNTINESQKQLNKLWEMLRDYDKPRELEKPST